jgi:hypothetical protein
MMYWGPPIGLLALTGVWSYLFIGLFLYYAWNLRKSRRNRMILWVALLGMFAWVPLFVLSAICVIRLLWA